jgi:hypothetical protein
VELESLNPCGYGSSWAVVRRPPSLCNQLLGDLGLALQPGQPRLVVHASPLLARAQALAHDLDDLSMAAAFCSSAQVGSRCRPARISARVMTGRGPRGLAVGAHQHREQALNQTNGPHRRSSVERGAGAAVDRWDGQAPAQAAVDGVTVRFAE